MANFIQTDAGLINLDLIVRIEPRGDGNYILHATNGAHIECRIDPAEARRGWGEHADHDHETAATAQAIGDGIAPDAAAAMERLAAMCWHGSLESILEIGRLLMAAKAALRHGEFQAMVRNDLPFGPKTAQRLMKIAGDERITKSARAHLLPPSWGTLYELSKLNDTTFAARLADGSITPALERRQVSIWGNPRRPHE